MNSGVTISGNDGQYNSGGVQLFGQAGTQWSFENVTITENTFRDFINADPNQLLGDTRHQSGFMGAVVLSVEGDTTAKGVSITNNVVTASADQVYSDKDMFALIYTQGNIEDVTIDGNTLSWESSSSETILEALSALNVPSSSYADGLAGIALVGGIGGSVSINQNVLSEALETLVAGVYIDGETQDFGNLSAVITETGNDYTGLIGDNALEMFIDSVSSDETPISSFTIEASEIYTPLDETSNTLIPILFDAPGSSSNITVSQYVIGVSAVAALDGDDTISLLGAGNTLVALDIDPSRNGSDTIFGFSPLIADDNAVDYINLFSAGIVTRGAGFQRIDADTFSAEIDPEAGIFVYEDSLGFTSENTLESFVDGLFVSTTDTFVVASSNGFGDTLLQTVSFTEDGPQNLGVFATLKSVSVMDLSAETFMIDADPNSTIA